MKQLDPVKIERKKYGSQPGVFNRMKSNKNPIKLNQMIGVRLGSAIKQNKTSFLL